MAAFSVISISIMLVLGVVLYMRFSTIYGEETVQSTRKLMEQTGKIWKITWSVCGRYQTPRIIMS